MAEEYIIDPSQFEPSYTKTTVTSAADFNDKKSNLYKKTDGIKIDNTTEKVTLRYFTDDGSLLDKETIPVIKDGTDGMNQRTIALYQRSATVPTEINYDLEWNFNTNNFVDTSHLIGWSLEKPSGDYPCYVIYAVASSNTSTVIIPYTSWSEPIVDSQNNKMKTIELFKRSASTPNKPSSDHTFNFETMKFNDSTEGWTLDIPEGANPCYVISAVASTVTLEDTIRSAEWSSPVRVFKDGEDAKFIEIIAPNGLIIKEGLQTSVTLNVNATGFTPSFYKWYKGTTQISTKNSITVEEQGVYSVDVVYNGVTYRDYASVTELVDGEDNFNFILTNENVNISVDTDKKPYETKSYSISMYGYRGLNALTASNTTPSADNPDIFKLSTTSSKVTVNNGTITYSANKETAIVQEIIDITVQFWNGSEVASIVKKISISYANSGDTIEVYCNSTTSIPTDEWCVTESAIEINVPFCIMKNGKMIAGVTAQGAPSIPGINIDESKTKASTETEMGNICYVIPANKDLSLYKFYSFDIFLITSDEELMDYTRRFTWSVSMNGPQGETPKYVEIEAEDGTIFYNGNPSSISLKAKPNFTPTKYQWSKDGSILSGKTGADLIVTEAGVYQVETFYNISPSEYSVTDFITVTQLNEGYAFTVSNENMSVATDVSLKPLENSNIEIEFLGYCNGSLMTPKSTQVTTSDLNKYYIAPPSVTGFTITRNTTYPNKFTLAFTKTKAISATNSVQFSISYYNVNSHSVVTVAKNISITANKQGNEGFSPEVSVTKNNNTVTISVTNKEGTQSQTVQDGENGKSITNQGNWQSGKVYHPLDSVYYSVTGNSYLCNTEHTSSATVTPESNNWTILAEKGEEGDAQFIHYVYADNPKASTSAAANYSKSETRKYVGVYRDNTEADADFDKLPSTITWSQIESDSTISYSVSNPNPNVSCDKNGTVSTFEGTSTLISVFENETQLQYSTTAGNGKFKYTNIAPNGCAWTTEPSAKGKDLSLPNLTAMTADNATRTVTIAGKFLDGTDFTLTVTQTFSKVKKGNDGNSLTITEQYTKYGSSTSGTVEPTTWVNNPPAVAQGNYLWTKNYKKYSDNKEEIVLGVEYQSKDGSNGYNIWNSSADATTTTTSIALNTVTVPSGYYVKAGDLIIASSLIFTVSSVSTSKATVTYQQSIKGSTGLSLECSVQSIKLNQRRNSTLDYDSQTFTCKLYRNLLSLTPSSCKATVSGTAGGVSVSANIVDSVCVVTVEASNGGVVCKDLIITVEVTCELKTYTFTVPIMAVTTGSYKGSKSTNEMPTASLSELGNYYCYIGEDGDYKKSYVYTCIRTGSSTYEWVIDNSDEANSVAFSDILSVIDNAEDKNEKSSLVVDRMVTSKLFAGFIAAAKIQFQHYVASIQEENLKSGDLLINMGENPRSTDESFDYQFALRQYLGKFNNTEKLLELFSVSKDKNSDVNSKVNINGSLLANKLEVSDSAYITDGTIETVGDIGFSAAYICCVLKYNGYYWALSTTTKGTLKVYKVSDVYDFKNATVKYTRTIKNININDACVFNNRIVIASEDGIYTLDYYGTIKRVKEGSWGGILEMGDTLVFYAGSGGSSNNVHTTDLETFVTESYGYRSAVKSDDEYYYTSYGCKNVFNNNLNIYKVKKDGTLYGSINLKDKVIPGIEGGITLLGEVACANNVIFCNIIVQQQSSTSRDEYSIYSIDCGETFNLIKNEDGTTINFEFGLRSFYINGLYILQSGFGLCYITSDLKKFTQIGSKDSNDYSDNYVLKPIMIDTEDDIGFYLGGKGYENSSQIISNYWLYGIHKRKYGSYIKKDITDDLVFNASFYTGPSTIKDGTALSFKVFKNESYECGKHTVYIIKIISNTYNWYYGKTGSVTISGLTGLSKENINVSISMKSSSPTGGLESSYKISDDYNIRFALYNRNEGTQFTLPTFDIKIEIWE